MPDQPNFLIIMSDQHNRDYMGCAGDTLVRSPNLDRLAAEGTRFTSTYCAAPWCIPSRMAFMSCRRPTNSRVWTNSHQLSSNMPTWAHAMGAAGYETALIGRMHFTGIDQYHGFEKRPLGEFQAVYPGGPTRGGPRFQHYPGATLGQSRVAIEKAGHGTTDLQYQDDRITEAACRYLREKQRGGDGRPFAALVGMFLPHCPFIAPKELFDYYYERVNVPEVEAGQPPTITAHREHRGILEPLSEHQVRVARAAYYALCEYTDRNIGRVLRALEASGQADHTVVIYLSDHGEMAGQHGCWWKSSYYEGSAGVPMIVRWPGVTPAGATQDAVCNLIDVGPTLIDVAGGRPLPGADGRSLRAFFENGDTSDWVNETFSEIGPTWGDPPSGMIRRTHWKLWRWHGDYPPALFDLAADPGEVHDLGQSPDPAHIKVREELLARLGAAWDGEHVLAECAKNDAEMAVLRQWGKAVKAIPAEHMPAPPPEFEDDVTLL